MYFFTFKTIIIIINIFFFLMIIVLLIKRSIVNLKIKTNNFGPICSPKIKHHTFKNKIIIILF